MSSFFYATLSYPDGTITGTEFDDYLYGTDSGEWLLGFGGNDYIRGNGGSDYLEGGDGNDTLEGGAGNDVLAGGLGNDTASYFNSTHGVIANIAFGTAHTLGAGPVDDDTFTSIENLTGSFYNDYFQGDELANRLDGNAGDDVLNGWGGDDMLIGGFGADIVIGGDGTDTVSGGFDNDTLQGNDGFDTLDYSYSYQGMFVSLAQGTSHTLTPAYYTETDSLSGFERIVGSYYDDILEGDQNRNVLAGSSGHDQLSGLGGNDVLDGGEGDDIMDGGAGADAFYGGAGIDTVDYRFSSNSVGVDLSTGHGSLGDAFGDTYTGMEDIAGSDSAGGDVLTGNDLANRIDGFGGNDVIGGLGGNDTIMAGYGNDYVDGGAGNDFINGGDGADHLDGGAGFDTASFAPSFGGIGPEGPGVTVDLRAGTASGLGNDGELLFNIEAVIGTSFDDVIAGSDIRNILHGGGNQDQIGGRGGNDRLFGEDGNDTLNGGTGNDLLSGGLGRDVTTGGLGNDSFVFQSLLETGATAASRDMIRDFTKGEDAIALSGLDANALIAGNQAFTFIDGDAFTAVSGQLRSSYDGSNTIVEGDVNGDAVADFQILLTGQINLSALDFIL